MDFQERKRHDEYWQKRLEAKAFYSSLGKVWCPVLSDWVVFNAQGFNHLLRKGGHLRKENDQMRRLVLLRYVNLIITTVGILSDYRKEETAEFWTLKAKIENKIVKVVVRQLVDRQKHFFSIMDNT